MMRIKAVAIILFNGEIHSMEAPNRHHDIIRELAAKNFPLPIRGTQGFLTDDNRFVNRIEAAEIAKTANQIRNGKMISPPRLTSEDLW